MTALALALVAGATLAAQTSASLTVRGRSNANASIAADGDTVVVAWAASVVSGPAATGTTDVYAAVSADGGRTFGPPVRVNDVDGDVRASGEQPPRVAVRKGVLSGPPTPEVFVSWVSKRDGTTIRIARSADGGRTFTASRAVSTPAAPGNRGWHAMTIDARGGLDIVWLDHREMVSQPPHQMNAATHGTHDGAAMAAHSGLYAARVTDAGVQPEQRVTTGVCYCCKTAIAAARDGSILAAWRHVYPGNIRDIAFARAADGQAFSPPVRVSVDQWELAGCPDDGPAMAIDVEGRTHIVWPTLVKAVVKGGEPTMALFHAMSRDGKSFTARVSLPVDGVAHHPQIAAARDGSLVAAWDELKDGTRHVALARGAVDADGRVRFVRERIGGAGPDAYPVVAAASGAVVVAWSSGTGDGSSIRVARVAGGRSAATHSR